MVYMDYGLIGNGQICALVSARGAYEWCCLPSFDSPSVFAKILDRQIGGHFIFEPIGNYVIEQEYLRNTNVLKTTYTSTDAVFEVIDFIPCWPIDQGEGGEGFRYYRPEQLYRLVNVLKGSPKVKIEFEPKLDYGLGKTKTVEVDPWTVLAKDNSHRFFLSSDIPAGKIVDGDVVTLSNGNFFIMSWGKPFQNPTTGIVRNHLKRTVTFWRLWIRNCYLPKEYQPQIIRSALTLKQLVYEKTGAIIAAPTTSIPEIPGGVRNWDYRFCWLRDAYFIIEALLQLSRFEVAEGFIGYLKHILQEQPEYIRPMFTIDGKVVPEEFRLEHWEGYQKSKPVHVGNNATTHHQNDVYGEMMLAMYPLFNDERVVREDTDELWSIVKTLVKIAKKKFPEEDNGLWEFRNFPRHYTFSKLLCWAALDRGTHIAKKLGYLDEAEQWQRDGDAMREEILERAWNDDIKAFTQAYDTPHLDASTLLMTTLGFIDADDPKMRSTILLSEEQLMQDGLAFRYTNHDDFGEPENSFTICTFWMIDALVHIGEIDKARKYFNNVLRYANHLGLFSEDVNPRTTELTGNFPQGYTHVAIINTATLLANQQNRQLIYS